MNKYRSAESHSSKKEHTSEDNFNELNICYRVCEKFVPEKEENVICECNQPEGSGHKKDSEIKYGTWTMLRNTTKRTEPAHGKLPNGAPFTRLALDTPEPKVERILRDVWHIPPPRLIMSVIGGAKYFTLSDQLESNFINGIIDVALQSDAWIMTNGFNVGIVQVVGQAISKAKLTNLNKNITAIGLCKWGSIKDVKNITDPQYSKGQKTKKPAVENDDTGEVKKREKGQRDLEMNHSHYLMLDDGTFRRYDTGDFRTRLCVQLAKLQHENDFPLPVVTIVVEGGRDTIANIYYDLRQNIPVVVIDGSGRVADFFKRWLLNTKDMGEAGKYSEGPYELREIDKDKDAPGTPAPSISQPEISVGTSRSTTKVELYFDKSLTALESLFKDHKGRLRKDLDALISNDDDVSKGKKRSQASGSPTSGKTKGLDTALGQVMYCLQPAVRSGITVFNLDSTDKLSETIFRSICKSCQQYFERKENEQNDTIEMRQRKATPLPTPEEKDRQSMSRQSVNRRDHSALRSQLLELAMRWDCIDVAKELILQNSLDNILNKEKALRDALRHNHPAFVYEFLKLGIDPSETFFPGDDFFTGKTRYWKFFEFLYKDKVADNLKTHLSAFIESEEGIKKQIHTTDDLNIVLATLIGDYMHKLYFTSNEDETKYQTSWGLRERNVETNQVSVQVVESDGYFANKANTERTYDYIIRDLFLWAILMNHTDMARVFLSHMKYRICAALIAVKILKQYHDKATHGDLKDTYLKDADYFQNYAIVCITQCEKNDVDQACQIVLQRIELYGNVTCLQVAADAKAKLFIATPCCVQAMNNIWYNKIHPDQLKKRNELAMAIGVFTLGLLAPFMVTYRSASEEKKEENPSRSLESYGLTYADPYSLKHPRYVTIPSVNEYLHQLKNFHQSLRMKYCYHCITYCFFLLLFSYVLLFDFQPPTSDIPSIHWTEILTIIFVSIMLIEEVQYLASSDSVTWFGKASNYIQNLFKIMTLIGIVLFYIGLILRFGYANNADQFVAARVVMAIDLEIWWLRSLSFMIVVPLLGPHLVAIGKMLKDLLFFMCIIAIVMIGYGVASRSMAYYPNADKFPQSNINTAFDGRSIFRQIVYPVYYLMYGQFGNEVTNLDAYPDAGWSISTHVLLAIHMIFVNILLTNLLIAMFSKRFDQVYDDTRNIWHSQQYIFTREYYTRSPFFPPISLFYDIYYLSRMTYFAVRRVCFKKPADGRAKVFKMIAVNKDVMKKWYEFEGASTYEYAHIEAKSSKTTSTVSTARLDVVKNDNKTDAGDRINDSTGNGRKVRDDLAKLNQSLDDVKTQLKLLLDAKNPQTSDSKCDSTPPK